jgi:hypothetical protein
VHQKVDVIAFAVEVAQLGPEALAHVAHDLFAARQHGVVEDSAPILGDEHQVGMKVMDDVVSPSDIGIWFPAW